MFEIRNLRKTYGNNGQQVLALDDIGFSVNPGEFVSLVGPSGCGKSTLLMCIGGLMEPSGGEVVCNGHVVTGPPREMVLVFQNYASSLFPWRTVLGNVLFALEGKEMGRSEKDAVARRALDDVGLCDCADRYPWQLSGGMQQRVAIARGLAYGSEIVLMDEPFASVDAQTREELEDLLLDVWQRLGKTILFVTHDIDEAVYLSDRIVVLSSRPSKVLDTIEVDIPRPRDQLATRALPRFVEMRTYIHSLLQSRSCAPANGK